VANADVVPFDYRAYADHMLKTARRMDESARKTGRPIALVSLTDAISRLGAAGDRWNAARDQALAAKLPGARLAAANGIVRQVERAFTRPTGLADRPWMRNLIFASDRDNGYSNIAFPSIVEAWQDRHDNLMAAEIIDLVKRFDAAAALLDRAGAELSGGK
jgi:hypothetical protein